MSVAPEDDAEFKSKLKSFYKEAGMEEPDMNSSLIDLTEELVLKLQTDMEELRQEMEESASENKTHQEQLSAKTKELSSTREQLATKKAEYQSIYDQITKLRTEKEKDEKALTEEINRLKKLDQKTSQKNDDLEKKLRELQAEHDDLAEKTGEKDDQIALLTGDNEELAEKIATAQQENKRLAKENAALKQEAQRAAEKAKAPAPLSPPSPTVESAAQEQISAVLNQLQQAQAQREQELLVLRDQVAANTRLAEKVAQTQTENQRLIRENERLQQEKHRILADPGIHEPVSRVSIVQPSPQTIPQEMPKAPSKHIRGKETLEHIIFSLIKDNESYTTKKFKEQKKGFLFSFRSENLKKQRQERGVLSVLKLELSELFKQLQSVSDEEEVKRINASLGEKIDACLDNKDAPFLGKEARHRLNATKKETLGFEEYVFLKPTTKL